ncbi:AAEL012626-PA, partial [Aedes aegypti]
TLQNINEPSAGTRLLYGARPLEKKARLSRSLTLPLFNFPGTNAFVGRLQQQPQPLEAFKTSSNNFFYEAKMAASSTTPVSGNSPKILLTTDDTSFDYRRKSSGGSLFTPSGGAPSVAPAEPHIYDFDEKRSSGDGSVVISITSPTAYQIPTSKSLGLNNFNFVNLQNVANTGPSSAYSSNYNTGNSSLIGSGNSSSNFSSSSIKRGSDVTAYGSSASAQLISNSTNNAIYRLARIINQTTKTPTSPGVSGLGSGLLQHQANDDSSRRLSWERRDKDSKRIPRSSSIDSMVDAVWSEFPSSGPGSARNSVSNQSAQSQSTSNVPSSLNIFLSSNRRESMLSPSSNRRSKHQRGISAIVKTLPSIK